MTRSDSEVVGGAACGLRDGRLRRPDIAVAVQNRATRFSTGLVHGYRRTFLAVSSAKRATARLRGDPTSRAQHGNPTVMNKSRLIAATALVSALLTSAFLTTPVLRPARAQAAVDIAVVDVAVVARGYRVSKLLGTGVVNDQDDRIGTVDDIIVDRDHHQVLFAVLQVGGFLGLGSHLVAVGIDSLVLDTPGKVKLPGATRDQLKKLPEFSYHNA
jgi:PRC-barrel domain